MDKHTDHTLAECLRASHPDRPFVEVAPDDDRDHDYLDPQGDDQVAETAREMLWSDQAAEDEFIDSAMQYLTEQNPEVPF